MPADLSRTGFAGLPFFLARCFGRAVQVLRRGLISPVAIATAMASALQASTAAHSRQCAVPQGRAGPSLRPRRQPVVRHQLV